MGLVTKLFGWHKHEESIGMGSGMHIASHSAASANTAKDPVCGMDVDKAATTSTYEGQTYYFCAPGLLSSSVKPSFSPFGKPRQWLQIWR